MSNCVSPSPLLVSGACVSPRTLFLPQPAVRPAPPAPIAPKAAPNAPAVAVQPPIAPKPVVAPPPAPASVAPEISKSPAPPPTAASPVALPVARAAEPALSSVGSAALSLPRIRKRFSLLQTVTASTAGPQSTDELKQQAARLQEQLSSLLFAETPKPAASALENSAAPELAQKVLDLTNFSPEPVVTQPVKSVTPPPKSRTSSLEVEEIKIPSWLAPLARESETPASAQSSAVESNSFAEAEAAVVEPLEEIARPESPETTRRPEVAIFGGQLLGESSQSAEPSPSGSRTGLFLGIAASLLLVAGGVWYSRQPGNAISGLLGGSQTASQPAISPEAEPAHSVSRPVSHPEVPLRPPVPLRPQLRSYRPLRSRPPRQRARRWRLLREIRIQSRPRHLVQL